MALTDTSNSLDPDRLSGRSLDRGLEAYAAGRYDQAMRAFADAVALAPDDAYARLALATAQGVAGQSGDAMLGLLALQAKVTDGPIAAQAALTLGALGMAWRLPGAAYGREHIAALEALIERDDRDPQPLGSMMIEIVKTRTPMARAFEIMAKDGAVAAASWLLAPKGRKIATDRLFLKFLSRTINVDAEVEKLLVALRAGIAALPGAELKDKHVRDLAIALIRQCLANEYVWSIDEAERARLAKAPTDADAKALLAMLYAPDALLRDAEALQRLAKGAQEPLRSVIVAKAREVAEERRLGAEIESLAPIEDEGSRQVRSHYEENPYPRWRGHVDAPPGLALFGLRASVPPPQTILIAGTGTGRQALKVAAFAGPGSTVVGLDLSRASLAYAKRMAKRLGLERVRFVQGDLLAVGRLGLTFDRIEAVGVLHHMNDPMAGWRALAACLAPGGKMKIGLYAKAARPAVEAARWLIKASGFEPTPDGIRAARRAILEAKDGEAAKGVLAFADFFSLSEARDLMFHPIEHRFSIPEIRAALAALGLDFDGFEIAEAQRAAFLKAHPAAGADRDLALWQAWEEAHPDAFVGMYNFYVRRA